MKWEYTGGQLGSTAIRTYRKGKLGKVVRTRMNPHTGPTSPGRIAYFVWALPDKEYSSEEQARRALGMEGAGDE